MRRTACSLECARSIMPGYLDRYCETFALDQLHSGKECMLRMSVENVVECKLVMYIHEKPSSAFSLFVRVNHFEAG